MLEATDHSFVMAVDIADCFSFDAEKILAATTLLAREVGDHLALYPQMVEAMQAGTIKTKVDVDVPSDGDLRLTYSAR